MSDNAITILVLWGSFFLLLALWSLLFDAWADRRTRRKVRPPVHQPPKVRAWFTVNDRVFYGVTEADAIESFAADTDATKPAPLRHRGSRA